MCKQCKYSLKCLSGESIADIRREKEQCACVYMYDMFYFYYCRQHFLTLERHKRKIQVYSLYIVANVNNLVRETLRVLNVHLKDLNLSDSRIEEIVNNTLKTGCCYF